MLYPIIPSSRSGGRSWTRVLAWAFVFFCGFWCRRAQALPSLVTSNDTCLSCHLATPAAALSFLEVDGAAVSGPPWGVTVSAGSGFNFVYRSTGLYTTTSYPDTGGAVIPPDTVNWVVYQGPLWNDNGDSGSTPWTQPNALFYRTNYPASDSVFDGGQAGLTVNNGQAGPPADMNGLASDEVMSAGVSVSASLAPGTYSLTVAAMGNDGNPVSCSQPFSVVVVQASPSATPSPPAAGSSPTDSPTPGPSVTASPTAAPTAPQVTGLSFPDVDKVAVGPNPAWTGNANAFFHLLADAQDVQVQVYDQSFFMVRFEDLGPRAGGWNRVALPVQGLAPQLYFVSVHVLQGAYNRHSPPALFYLMP